MRVFRGEFLNYVLLGEYLGYRLDHINRTYSVFIEA